MNGAECGECGEMVCQCEKLDYLSKRVQLTEDYTELIECLHQILLKPKGLRLKILKWLYPEITEIADELREYYWSR